MSGIRGRLLFVVVGLVTLTSASLGVGAYAYVATSLREQALEDARTQTNFNVAVLADEALSRSPTREDVLAGGILDAFELRGATGAAVDLGDGDPIVSGFVVTSVLAAASPELPGIVASGSIGYERVVVGGRPYLVTGARRPGGGPDFYFVFDAAGVEDAIARLGQALLIGGLILAVIAVLSARAVAARILRPVAAASQAAGRMAVGELATRLEIDSDDEFGTLATSFNRMAASLDATVSELRAAEARQRRFVADVSHELRTPLSALVQEAAVLRDHVERMPPEARRAAELLAGDVARLRGLVDELMELSRFDADAERMELEEVDLARLVRAVVAGRAPGAMLDLPSSPARVVTDRRRIERILVNLLDNAQDHAGGAGVSVTLSTDATVFRLAVADRGPGVPEAELANLFARFHKADASRHEGGSGLGLALVQEHAELLGGTVSASLRGGGGLRVEVVVPVTQPLPERDGPVIPDLDPENRPVPQGS